MLAGPVSSGMVSGTTAMLLPMRRPFRRLLRARGVGLGLGGLGVEHVHRADQQQHAAAHLKALQRDVEELQNLQAQQRTGRNHANDAERRRADGAAPLRRGKALGVVDEERHDGQRVDDGQQGDEGLDVMVPRSRVEPTGMSSQ
jgi:hypothetical protein